MVVEVHYYHSENTVSRYVFAVAVVSKKYHKRGITMKKLRKRTKTVTLLESDRSAACSCSD